MPNLDLKVVCDDLTPVVEKYRPAIDYEEDKQQIQHMQNGTLYNTN